MVRVLKGTLKKFFSIIPIMILLILAYEIYDNQEQETNVINTNNVYTNINEPEEIESTLNVSNNRFYYNQLDSYAKIIYDAMAENIDNLKTGDYRIDIKGNFENLLDKDNGQSELNKAYDEAVNAINLDVPDLFYIDFSRMYLNVETTTSIFSKEHKLYIDSGDGPNYLSNGFYSQEDVRNATNRIEEVRTEVLKNIKDDKPFNQIKTVHDYLIDKLKYDESSVNKNTVYGAIIEEKCVCEGYARSFKYFLDELGINSILVVGIGTNSEGKTENHMWNYVELDGKWYAVDVTWDDPIVYGGGKVSDKVKHRYLLIGGREFLKNHVENQTISNEGKIITLPKLNDDNY